MKNTYIFLIAPKHWLGNKRKHLKPVFMLFGQAVSYQMRNGPFCQVAERCFLNLKRINFKPFKGRTI